MVDPTLNGVLRGLQTIKISGKPSLDIIVETFETMSVETSVLKTSARTSTRTFADTFLDKFQ